MEKIIQTKSNLDICVIKPGKKVTHWFKNNFVLDILATSDVHCELNLITNELKLTSETDFKVYDE